MNLANKITMFRVLLIPVFLFVYLGNYIAEPSRSYAALLIFISASFTDFLDGYIARSRNLITNFGKFADPLADKLLVCSALVCMVEKHILPSWLVILILCREFIITAFRTIAASENIIIAASWWGKLKTIVQMLMIIFCMAGFSGRSAVYVSWALIWAAAFLTVVSAIDYIYKNKQVLKG